MLDDAGYGDFGAYGSTQIQTPVFDQMCREGIRFTDHYSGSAVCASTRCVLMTGLHTGHCRRRDNQAKANRDRNREHARNTRLRKKAYLEKLKTTVDELCRERDTLVSERLQDLVQACAKGKT